MPKVYLGKKNEPAIELKESKDLIAVRTRSKRSLTTSAGPVPSAASEQVEDGKLVAAYPEAGVEVYRVPVGRGDPSVFERKTAIRKSPDVRFAGSVLVDPDSDEPVLYTENLFIKFTDQTDPDDCLAILRDAGLTVKAQVTYATNAYFVAAPEGTGQAVFDIALKLIAKKEVEYCHPELIRQREMKAIFPQQWHLKKTTVGGVVIDAHANVEKAHEITRGEGATIAIIDNGVDIDHPELRGAGKVVAPRDVTRGTDDPRPKDDFPLDPDDHGTAVAGVACASGNFGASGVAPAARLIPIRLASGLGSQNEADAFKWAADNGADVISCSWGPPDGRWSVPDDPRHARVVPLPANTRLAIDYAVSNGRGGKGCVVLFAAGNGNESVDNDGYASYSKVIAVAACNDRGTRSVYSDFGNAVWCAFPSNDIGHVPFNHPSPLTPGIWTTDRVGAKGYNGGNVASGDAAGDYTNSFGGTSSACPGAAGVAALILSVNPGLKWNEVKDLLKRACDRIDPQDAGWDASGRSPKYGFGRLNARTAVELARPEPRSGVTISRTFDAPIPDMQTVTFELVVPDDAPVQALSVAVSLKHSYVGDLILTLLPPQATGVNAIVLRNREGGAAKDLDARFDADTTPGLAAIAGKSCKGTWTLRIEDAAAADSGTLVSFSLGLSLAHPDRAPRPIEPRVPSRAPSRAPRRVQRSG